ncbi:helix-turn-helix domain-containing protein [Methylobacterium sp. J-072]|uniref:helix-turn-helix domain-containing protein n=1 Tax=Methylobacterium sp. J-072 TaxID=2836651 RepID=UPI001FBBC412|nr:helix-turn-helix domain-containing protein [Methylobacterium sp. J-072]MCJ2094790.1 helix-turn-helix domain-containing protein [Methylobacterium sp. J-072]
MTIVRTRTPAGEAIVILPEAEFERLRELAEDTLDTRVIDESQSRLNAGDEELLDESDLDALRAAPSPLAFWRARRGMTVAALARDGAVPEVQLTDLETGAGTADPAVYERLARVLDVAVEDLVPESV